MNKLLCGNLNNYQREFGNYSKVQTLLLVLLVLLVLLGNFIICIGLKRAAAGGVGNERNPASCAQNRGYHKLKVADIYKHKDHFCMILYSEARKGDLEDKMIYCQNL